MAGGRLSFPFFAAGVLTIAILCIAVLPANSSLTAASTPKSAFRAVTTETIEFTVPLFVLNATFVVWLSGFNSKMSFVNTAVPQRASNTALRC
jgi:hypothetical protein